jgi:hypothetical protein
MFGDILDDSSKVTPTDTEHFGSKYVYLKGQFFYYFLWTKLEIDAFTATDDTFVLCVKYTEYNAM